MAAYISFQPSDFFSTKLYTGNGTAIGSGGLAVTGVGFQPDFTWIKNRDQTDNNMLEDSVRGATKYLVSNTNAAEATSAESLTTWGADGFTLGEDAAVNTNAEDYVSWNWKMGTTTGIDTTGSTITPTGYSFNATTKQSIIKYTGNEVAGAKVPHGLGVIPQVVLVKRTQTTGDWQMYHAKQHTTPEDYYLALNSTAAAADNNSKWNDTAPDAVNFTLGDSGYVNGDASTYIAYCFADVKGYSKFGSYYGNSNADGAFVYTGFKPAYVLIKATVGTINWNIYDTKRTPYNPEDPLWANTTGTESSIGVYNVDLLSNGFKARTTSSQVNSTSYDPYVYMAFAEEPIVSSNSKAGTAR
jgi:hypothetical protein